MSEGLWGQLRRLRYALPARLGSILPAPGHEEALRLCAGLYRQGLKATLGYFQADDAPPETIVAAYRTVAARAASNATLSVKAPPLAFAMEPLEAIAATGLPLVFDAHRPAEAERTLAAMQRLLVDYPATGVVLPARWQRSANDVARLRDTTARIRLVKGEWADPDAPEVDIAANYLCLAEALAGRAAPVAVATHDPLLAERALRVLLDGGTPCELEQLRGLPRRRTLAVAREFGVPVRIYVPFGPGWWPYAIDKTLARPYLPLWWLRDALGLSDPSG